MSVWEDVAFLTGSQNRKVILRALAIEPRRPTVPARYYDCARETAQWALAGLCDRGWAKRRSDGLYHLTPGETMVHERYERSIETVECVDRMNELLADAADICENVPLDVLGQINITIVADSGPHTPLNRYSTIIGSEPVDRFHGVTPIVNRVFNESAEAVLGRDIWMELIIDHGVLECSMDAYPGSFKRTRDLDQFKLRVTEENLDFDLLMVDGYGPASTYGEHNSLTTFSDGDASEIVSWVGILYGSIRSALMSIDHLKP